jgi:signal transduction histidine kinase
VTPFRLPVRIALPLMVFGTFLLLQAITLILAHRNHLEDLRAGLENRALVRTVELMHSAAIHLPAQPHEIERDIDNLLMRREIAAVAILAPDGSVAIAHDPDWLGQPLPALLADPVPASSETKAPRMDWSADGRRLHTLLDHLPHPSPGGWRGTVYIGHDIGRDIDSALRDNLALYGKTLGFDLLIVLLLYLWLLQTLVRPIDQLASTADAIRAGTAARYPDLPAGTELGRLARALNEMQARLRADEKTLRDNLVYQRELVAKLDAANSLMLQAEKLASIGQLAAGVSHELNNPVGFVKSNLGTLENYLRDVFAIADAYASIERATPPCPCPELDKVVALKREKDYDFLRTDIFQLVTESQDGLARVARIVMDLKDFSRAGTLERQWADLHQGLDSTLNIVWNELKYKCEIRKAYGILPPVWCDPSQLNQVFMNLLVNAGHAIADKGEIAITTGQQGDAVFVAIADTGTGIAPENLKRIFDPFFTTKPVGQGTGLGLWLAYGIVQKHNGRIEVQSEPGKGATFTVWLPIGPPADNPGAVPPAPTLEPS